MGPPEFLSKPWRGTPQWEQFKVVLVLVPKWCLTLANPWTVACQAIWNFSMKNPWNFPGSNAGKGYHSLLQGIFPTQESNLGFLYCKQILYRLSYQWSPVQTESQWIFLAPSENWSPGINQQPENYRQVRTENTAEAPGPGAGLSWSPQHSARHWRRANRPRKGSPHFHGFQQPHQVFMGKMGEKSPCLAGGGGEG